MGDQGVRPGALAGDRQLDLGVERGIDLGPGHLPGTHQGGQLHGVAER